MDFPGEDSGLEFEDSNNAVDDSLPQINVSFKLTEF